MTKDVLDPVALLQGYVNRLTQREKDVKAVEAKAKRLSKQYDEITSKRAEISEDVHERQQAIAALISEREGLKQAYASASFEADEPRLSQIQARKSEIDDAVLDHQEALEQLQQQLAKSKVDEYGIAETLVELEGLKPGDAFRFAAEMKTVLMRHEFEQQQLIASAKKLLPNVKPSVIEAVRMEDPDYAEANARQRQEKDRINERAHARALKESKPEVRHVRVIDNRTGRVVGYDLLDRNGNKVGYQSKEDVYHDA